MCMGIFVCFLDSSTIIAAVLPQNNSVGTFIANTSSSRMEDIYFEDISPGTAAINSDSVDLVANMACSLLI